MIPIQPLTVGPIVGHADTDHVRIWGRAKYEPLESGVPRRVFGVARIKKKVGGSYRSPKFFKMNPNFDLTGIFISSNLIQETDYTYQIGWFFSDKELDEINTSDDWDWSLADQGEFQTSSDDSLKERAFVFGSCRYLLKLFGGSWFDSRGDKTFRSINEKINDGKNINKLLMIGDQIYADDLNFVAPDKQIEEFYSRYRDAFSQKHIKKLMSNVSTYMTLDDHEIENNWPSDVSDRDMLIKYPAAIHSYQVYQMSHSPLFKTDENKLEGIPEKFHYDFTDGCCDFFVTDTRTERDPDNEEIIGDEQMSNLLSWLNNGTGHVKLIVSSVPFFPDTKKPSDDKWSGFKFQRDTIISHIQTHKIKNVVFLSGDVHCSMSSELDISPDDDNPLKIYSIISSAFYWPYPHMKKRRFNLEGHVSSVTDKNAYKMGKVSDVYSSDNFTRVNVKPSGLKIEVFNRKGRLKHEDEFTF